MDYTVLASVIVAICGVLTAVVAKSKLDNTKGGFMAILDDLIQMLIFGHAIATGEQPIDEANMKTLAKDIEKVWVDLKGLGPKIQAMLESKEPTA